MGTNSSFRKFILVPLRGKLNLELELSIFFGMFFGAIACVLPSEFIVKKLSILFMVFSFFMILIVYIKDVMITDCYKKKKLSPYYVWFESCILEPLERKLRLKLEKEKTETKKKEYNEILSVISAWREE